VLNSGTDTSVVEVQPAMSLPSGIISRIESSYLVKQINLTPEYLSQKGVKSTHVNNYRWIREIISGISVAKATSFRPANWTQM